MTDPKKICMGCMKTGVDSRKICPYCGFDPEKYAGNSRWLPLQYILNGKYMIGKVIGEGGFGITYVGWDLNLEVRVAIKEYFPVGLAARETGGNSHYSLSALMGEKKENYRHGLKKFMEEAQSLSKFYHLDGIVAVKDFFFENETAYMVMEYVDGITLKEYLKERGGKIETEDALKILRPVIRSLQQVHKAGIIHRDISPDNIMITKQGETKLIDFGAARLAGNDRNHTFTIVLKHGYAPPEQYQTKGNQGPWTDVYAICATLYRMITGQLPPNAMDRLAQDSLRTFTQLGLHVSEQISDAVVKKGMALRIQQRYQSMDELYEDLFIMKESAQSRLGKKEITAIVAGAAVILVLLTVGGISVLNRTRSVATVARLNESGSRGEAETPAAEPQTAEPETAAPAPETKTTERETAAPARETEQTEPETAAPAPEPRDLRPFIEAAAAAGENLSAAGYHVVYTAGEGPVSAKGTNDHGMLDVGGSGWTDVESLSTGPDHTVGVRKNHTAVAAGDASDGKCAVEIWNDVVQVAAGKNHTLGRKADGSVLAIGSNDSGQLEAAEWENVEYVAAGDAHSLGLQHHRVTAAGDDSKGQCQVEDWKHVAAIDACGNVSAALTEEGKVLLAGDVNEEMKAALEWRQVVDISLGDGYIAGLLYSGEVVAAGSFADGKFVWEDVKNRDIAAVECSADTIFAKTSSGEILEKNVYAGETRLADMQNVKKAASGDNFLVGMKEDGTALLYSTAPQSQGMEAVREWSGLKDIAAAGKIAVGLKEDGSVVTAGEFDDDCGWMTDMQQVQILNGRVYGLTESGSVLAEGEGAEDEPLYFAGNIKRLSSSRKGGILALTNDGDVFNGMITLESFERENAQIKDLAVWNWSYVSALYDDGRVVLLDGDTRELLGWEKITQIAAGIDHMIGLREDGTVEVTGSGENGQCDVSGWKDIVWVGAGDYQSYGITKDGELLIAGNMPGQYEENEG